MGIEGGWKYQGYETLLLENHWFRLTILLDKGFGIYKTIYKPKDIALSWNTSWGLRPKGQVEGFMENYEGGWQIVFPNAGPPVQWQGAHFDQHGDINMVSWQLSQTRESKSAIEITGQANSIQMPFDVKRTIKIFAERPSLNITTTVTNTSNQRLPFMLGEHLVFGSPFLEPEQGFIEIEPETDIFSQDGSKSKWPFQKIDETVWDLSKLGSRGSTSSISYLTNFKKGCYRIFGKDPSFGIELNWDRQAFPYLWLWRELGQGGYPWYGKHYNIGLEPFTSYPTNGLVEAIENGSAIWIDPYKSLEFWIDFSVVEIE